MSRFPWLVLVPLLAVPAPAEPGEPFFRDGDRIVFIGDSITVGAAYQKYIENFLRTRFPRWTLGVRNAGVNGCTAQLGLPLVDRDVLAWRPTAAVVNYGMNDGRRKDGLDYYRSGIAPYVEKLLANRVRVALCSNTPVDIGDEPGRYTGHNLEFDAMARFARTLAAERGLAMADQFHCLHAVWGENRKRPKPVPVSEQTLSRLPADSVHVRAGGYTTMAWCLLKQLGAPREVSHAAIDAATGKATTRQCEIREFQAVEGGIAFVRADLASPCWIDDVGAPGLELVPFQDELNRMTLEVTGLRAGTYELRIDGLAEGRYSAAEFARGIDLARNRASAVYVVGRRVHEAIQGQMRAVAEARAVLAFQAPEWLRFPDLDRQKQAEFDRRRRAIDAQDASIAGAAAPEPHRYELRPAL